MPVSFDETLFAAMRDRPLRSDLVSLDDAILAGVRERRQLGSVSRAALGACGALALGVGVAGGTLVTSSANASEPELALTSANALAPSQLLDGI
jgi:hypothetical protein